MDLTVLGMISGTSFDAIDVAVADLSVAGDEVVLTPRGLHSEPMPPELVDALAASLPPAQLPMAEVCRIDTALGQAFGRAAATALDGLAGGRADLVVSHGQTVYHWVDGPAALGTLQLGSPAWIAEATGLPVVSDLRTRDITRGGQGAPLASTLDALLVLGPGSKRGSLNLGGIANITVAGPGGEILAYDIGPANGLMDGYVAAHTDGAERMDTGGERARRGRVVPALLADLLDDPYYPAAPPKSTGKEYFHQAYLEMRLAGRRDDPDDVVATLCELTATIVAGACSRHHLEEVLVAGGGIRNPTLMSRLADLAPDTVFRDFTELGLPAQSKEAYLMALLGYLSAHGVAGTIPSATGASSGSVLGSFTPGAGPLTLPEPLPAPPRSLRINLP